MAATARIATTGRLIFATNACHRSERGLGGWTNDGVGAGLVSVDIPLDGTAGTAFRREAGRRIRGGLSAGTPGPFGRCRAPAWSRDSAAGRRPILQPVDELHGLVDLVDRGGLVVHQAGIEPHPLHEIEGQVGLEP